VNTRDSQPPHGRIRPISLPFLFVILIWAVFILPSSFHPNWSYLDDPANLYVAKSVASNLRFPSPDPASGRYFPFYYVYYGLLFKLFEYKLYGYYIVQSMMFLLISLMIYSIIFNHTGKISSGIFGAFLFITASPVAENAYTLGKAEPKILFYLLCSVWIFRFLISNDRYKRKINRLLSWVAIAILVFVAILTKETAVVIIIFAFTGVGIAFLLQKKGHTLYKNDVTAYLLLLLTSVFSAVMARALFFAVRPAGASSSYTTYRVTLPVILYNLKFYVGQQPDVLLLGLISGVLLGALYKEANEFNAKRFVFGSAICLTGWAYIFGQLIWRWPTGYYLLVPSALFPIVVGITACSRVSLESKKVRNIVFASIILMCFTRIHSIPYFWFIAHAQKAEDKIYSEAVENYMRMAKPGERLLIEQWLPSDEPIVQSNILIKELFGKKQLNVDGVRDIVSNTVVAPDALKHRNVREIPGQTNRFPEKNDYILTFTGDRRTPWALRAVSPFVNEKESAFKTLGMPVEKIIDKEIRWRGLQTQFPLIGAEFKEFSAGYKLYKVGDPAY